MEYEPEFQCSIQLFRYIPTYQLHRDVLRRLRSLYETSFPFEEQRPWSSIEEELTKNKLDCYLIYNDRWGYVGFCTMWHCFSYDYIEHLVISPSYRNLSIGTQVLRTLGANSSKTRPLILETEPPDLSEEAARRLFFYQRNGFDILTKDYLQPPYHAGDRATPLYLLSNHPEVLREHVGEVVLELQREVYSTSPFTS